MIPYLHYYYYYFLAVPWDIWNLVPRQRIKPVPPVVEVQSLNHWRSRKVQSTTSDLLTIKTIFFSRKLHFYLIVMIDFNIKAFGAMIFFQFLPQSSNFQHPIYQRSNCQIHWIIKKTREFQKNIYFCFIEYTKAFNCVGHNKLWKSFKEMRIADLLTCLLRNLCAGQKQQLETDMKQQTGSKSGKEYIKAVYVTLLI